MSAGSTWTFYIGVSYARTKGATIIKCSNYSAVFVINMPEDSKSVTFQGIFGETRFPSARGRDSLFYSLGRESKWR
jgi:hypothetical protein